MINRDLTIIGRAERVDFSELGFKKVPAKIDTGADASSIWGSATVDERGKLDVVFFGPESELYDGRVHVFPKSAYSITRIASSFGHKELRYKVKLSIKVKGRTIRGTFTLSDRSNKLYPVLLGRSLLTKKFLVDVSKGTPLREAEKRRLERLEQELSEVSEV